MLDPVIKAQTVKSGPGYARLIEAQLKAFITSGKVEPAIASMKALEQSGGASGRAQLYFKLGKLLEKELERSRTKGNTAALARMHQAYRTFLTTLADSKTGQSYESLQWAGEGLLTLDAYADAEKVLRRVLTEFTADPQFLQQQGGRDRLLRTRLRLVTALRGQGKFDEANSILDELLTQKPPYSRPCSRRACCSNRKPRPARAPGRRPSATGKTWPRGWNGCARGRRAITTPGITWRGSSIKQKDPAKARQTLMGVMRLSPSVGGPEMKAKYKALLAKLK